MLKKHLSLIFCLILIFVLANPCGTAKAGGGTAWSKWFSTGTISTRPADNVAQYSAELKGHVQWKNRRGGLDLVRDAHFKYIDLTDSSMGWQSVTVVPVPSKGGDFSETVHGLIPGHTYQYYTYLHMTSSGGHDDGGHCKRFTTLPGNGTCWSAYSSNGVVVTSPAQNVGKYEAELRGHVEWQNRHAMIDLVRDAHFKYRDLTDTSKGWQSVTVVPVPTGGGDFSVRLRGLTPGHNYQYYTYLNMTMSGGHDDSGHSKFFTTQQGTGTPWSAYSSDGIVATIAAENVTRYEAELKGHVEWQNQHGMIDLVRDAHFKYLDLTDSSKGWQSVTVTPVPTGGGDFSARLRGLTPGHKYQFYSYLNMTVSGGHDDSAHSMTFTTLPGKGTPWTSYSSNGIVVTMAAENVTQYSADLKGHVQWQNRHAMIDLVRDAHFWYIDNTNPHAGERSVTVTPVPSRGGDFTAHLSGLVPGHSYTFYAYINSTISGKHTDFANAQSFTTKPGKAASWQPPNVNHGGASDGILATLPVQKIGQYSADLSCHAEWQNKSTIIFEKDYITDLGFYYDDGSTTGKTTSALHKASSLPLHTKGGDFIIHLGGLQPGHTYTCYPYVEMAGTDSKWMSEAEKVTFTTLPGTGTPWKDKSSIGIISTLAPSNVTNSTAVLHGHVEWQNQNYLINLVRDAHFRYQDITRGDKTWKKARVTWAPTRGGDFSVTISGLTKGHAYRFYPYVNMTMGGSYNDSAHAFVFTAGGGKPLAINGTLPTAVVGKPYTAALTATGGDGRYTWNGTVTAWNSSIEKGDGLNVYPNGVITGVPVMATPKSPRAPLQVWVTVTDRSGNTGSASFNIKVIDKLKITTASLPGGLAGTAYKTSEGKTVTLAAAGGEGRYTWSGTITPANGLTLKADGSITGTPQAALTSIVTAVVKDSSGNNATSSFNIGVFDKLKITTASLPGGLAGAAYKTSEGKTVTLGAAGGDGHYIWSGTITPANGLSLKSDGSIIGTPRSLVPATLRAAVRDGSGNKAVASFSIPVFNKLKITTAMLPGGVTGASYETSDGKTVTLTATGGDGNYTWSGTIKPANGTLRVTADGKIVGIPSEPAGDSPLTVAAEVKDGSGNSEKASFKLLINDPLPAGIVGQLYKINLAGSGGDGKYTWSGTIKPANGTLCITKDGKITGTPAAATGTKPLSVKAVVKDGSGNAGGIILQLSVYNKAVVPLAITTTSLPEISVRQSYSASLAASGGDGCYTWSGTITPANGLTLNPNGSINGAPRSALASTVSAIVSDSRGNRTKAKFTIRPKGIITLSLAETTIDMDNNKQLKCFFTVNPADANVAAFSSNSDIASCSLGGGAGSYWLTLTAGSKVSSWDRTATITVLASKAGRAGVAKRFTVRAPDAVKSIIIGGGGGYVIPVTVPAPGLTSLSVSRGTIAGATMLTDLSYPGTASYAVYMQKDAFARPNLGDSIPAGAFAYPLADNIRNIQDVTPGIHLGVYALNASGRIIAFTDHVLLPSEIAVDAPPIESFEVLPVNDGQTIISDLEHPGAASFAVFIQGSAFDIPLVGDRSSNGAVAYTSGTEINGVEAGQHLGIYALDAEGKIIAFSDHVLLLSEIAVEAPQIESFKVLPVDDGQTIISDLNHPDVVSFAVYIQDSVFDIPLVGESPPDGAVAYGEGKEIHGVEPFQHLGIYALDAEEKIIAFSDYILILK